MSEVLLLQRLGTSGSSVFSLRLKFPIPNPYTLFSSLELPIVSPTEARVFSKRRVEIPPSRDRWFIQFISCTIHIENFMPEIRRSLTGQP
ncbi:hypothetical protein MtrunA17_Chr4g0049481 [Medicago truncatula]|uniref:Uncharacterized protein n=1 Tax=Medicago truncatula TaxID=3880 RepID=A0A396II95_MEDTR|nr:hypothetical protein MtrunA17_Chr4g0049481 [Medicago truncatula]